jgi:hypothetical protein
MNGEHSAGMRVKLRVLVAAGGLGLLGGAAGCENMETDGVATITDEIIGGTTIDVATRRSLGLVDLSNGCSGALFRPDWVLTATHCLDFTNPAGRRYGIPRTDSNPPDERRGSLIVQLGTSDMSLVQLQAPAAGNMWPSVSHIAHTGSESSWIGQDLTCYGRGATDYDTDGIGVIGGGVWKSLTKRIENLVTDPFNGDAYRILATGSPGRQTYAPGDSGANCIADNRVVAVASAAGCGSWQGQDMGVACSATNVTSLADTRLRAIRDFLGYMSQAPGRPATHFVPLTLSGGWAPAPFASNRPSVTKTSDVVTLRGAISSGVGGAAFTLPTGYRPSARVYVPIVTANNTIGRLLIESNGSTSVESEGGSFLETARTFSSLEDVSFLENTTGTTPLTLVNGWTTAAFSNRAPAVKVVNRYVHFQGAMAGSTVAHAFSLPAGFRPTVTVYVPIGLCNAAKGRLTITSSGTVLVSAENGNTSAMSCFTSLEGASFSLDELAFRRTPTLRNGWGPGGFSSGTVRFNNDGGIVRFQGAASGGTAAHLFSIPVDFAPATNVWMTVDLFGAARGRVKIQPDGAVMLDPASQLSTAASFISFEGASFGL